MQVIVLHYYPAIVKYVYYKKCIIGTNTKQKLKFFY